MDLWDADDFSLDMSLNLSKQELDVPGISKRLFPLSLSHLAPSGINGDLSYRYPSSEVAMGLIFCRFPAMTGLANMENMSNWAEF